MSIITTDDRRGADVAVVREVCATQVATVVTPTVGLYSAFKLSFDYALALFLLILTAPVVLFAMLAIKLTSRGPAVYMQTRLGRAGKPFVIYKLRTMAHQCESLTGAQWCTTNDPRVTNLGRILRKTHIDELPQLWNVLKGEMSLIGPRPERPEFLPQLEHAIPHYKARLQVRPGVTGLAQVQWPADTNLASVRIKLAYDLYYVRHFGFWLDCRILLSTAAKMAALPFHVTRRLFGFPVQAVVEQEYKFLSAS